MQVDGAGAGRLVLSRADGRPCAGTFPPTSSHLFLFSFKVTCRTHYIMYGSIAK